MPTRRKERTPDRSASNIDDRIHRLERLITSLAASKKTTLEINSSTVSDVETDDPAKRILQVADPSPRLTIEDQETHFVDSSHWEAILEDVCPTKTLLDKR
jgi:hypothetical protein